MERDYKVGDIIIVLLKGDYQGRYGVIESRDKRFISARFGPHDVRNYIPAHGEIKYIGRVDNGN